MLDCRKCGFMVTKDMGFSVKENKCPACGSTLMANDFLSDVRTIKTEIAASRVLNSSDVDDNTLTLLSILIKNRFMTDNDDAQSEVEEVIESKEEEVETFDDIRDKIRNEALAESQEEDVPVLSDIERKKTLARNNPFKKKTGAMVNRISS